MEKGKKKAKFESSDYEDLALLESIKRGNQDAFALLFKKYNKVWLSRIKFQIHSKEDAEDLVSEIFLKVYQNIHSYKKEDSATFKNWINQIAHHTMIDFIRNKKKLPGYHNGFSINDIVNDDDQKTNKKIMEYEIPSNEPEAMTASEEVEHHAKLKIIYSAIDKLPEIYLQSLSQKTQDIYRLYKENGKTSVEIALEFGMSLTEINNQINRIIRIYHKLKLDKEILKMYYIEDLPYETIAKRLKLKLGTMKVNLMRAREKLISSINIRQAVIEVSSIYTMEQLNIEMEKVYKLGGETI